MQVHLTHKKSKPFKYIYLLQSDGIGTQFIYISRLLDYAIANNCKLMVDFRQMAFFLGWGASCEETELNKVFCFATNKVIYGLAEIDKVLSEKADEVIGVRFCEEKFDPRNMVASFVWANDFLPTDNEMNASCSLIGKLKLVGEYEKTFNEYIPLVASCIGIHARLGNGEQHIANGGSRMKISRERFFNAMDVYGDGSFFVCTDTPSFLEACINRYGSRVIALNRFRPPENCGPGHNTWSIYDKEKRTEYMAKRNQVGAYRLLGDALVEMFLLGECKKLICNNSSFTHYARVCCGVSSLILK